MTEQEIWLKAWYAAIACENCPSKTATEIADKCLQAYKERFPAPEPVINKTEVNRELLGAANDALRALIWCSGSDDFCEGGKAYVGWENLAQPAIDRLQKVLQDKQFSGIYVQKLDEYGNYVGERLCDGELNFKSQDSPRP
jgi:hypothetical protein